MQNQIVLDTNILVFFFEGNRNASGKLVEYDCCISSITQIEISSNKNTTASKRRLIEDLISGFTVIHTNPAIVKIAINFMLSYKIKIADAIIAATAKFLDLPLLTADEDCIKLMKLKL